MPDIPDRSRVRFASIEACRGIAAMMVAANHCAHTLGASDNFGFAPFGLLFQFGRSGADLFFVLSGFLISLLHWRDIGQPSRFRHYLARRLTRIYPSYWLVLFIVIPFDAVTHTLFEGYGDPLRLAGNILLLPGNDRIIDVTWSLSNELLFYALAALAILSRTWGMLALGAWVIALIVRPVAAPLYDAPWLNLATYPMNFEFIAGALAGWFFQWREIRRPGMLLAIGLAILAAFAVAEDLRLLWSQEDHLWYPGGEWRVLLLRTAGYGTAYMLIIAGLAGLENRGTLHVPPLMLTLGGASYLLYLVHVPALLILGAGERHAHLLRWLPGAALAGLFLLATAAAAIALHLIVEKPLLRAIRPQRGS